jgi:hypothetical protein
MRRVLAIFLDGYEQSRGQRLMCAGDMPEMSRLAVPSMLLLPELTYRYAFGSGLFRQRPILELIGRRPDRLLSSMSLPSPPQIDNDEADCAGANAWEAETVRQSAETI